MSSRAQLATGPTIRKARRAIHTGSGQRGAAVALLAILIITSSLGFQHFLPVLSLGINLRITDLLLLGGLSCIVVRRLAVSGFRLVRTPLDLPLLAFYGVTLFSTIVAVAQSSLDRDSAIGETRIFSYYLTFFIVTNLVRERRQLDFLVNGILLLGTIVALAMVAQYVLGGTVQLMWEQVGGEWDFQGSTFGTALRIAPPGHSIVLVALVTLYCTILCDRLKPKGILRGAQCVLLGMAILVTFLRSYWAATIVVLALAGYLVKGVDRRRLIGWGVAALVPGILLLLVTFNAPNLPISHLIVIAWEKFGTATSVHSFTGGDPNYNYRRHENQHAFVAIASHPIIGLGLGAAYRPVDLNLDGIGADGHFVELTRFIHNGHLGIMLQSGLLGYSCFVWLSAAFLLRGFRNWRKVPDDRLRAVVLGFCLVYLDTLIFAPANSVFREWFWVPVLGMMIGINEVILRQAGLTRIKRKGGGLLGRAGMTAYLVGFHENAGDGHA